MNNFLKSIGAGIVTFAAAATIAGLGYGLGKDSKGDLLILLERENSQLKLSNAKLSAENESLRVKVLTTIPKLIEVVSTPSPIADSKISDSEPTEEVSQTIKVPRQQTASFFDGAIEVTTISIEYSGNPLRNRVYASLFIPGREPVKLKKADPGTVQTIGEFQVAVVETDTFYATYKVFRARKT